MNYDNRTAGEEFDDENLQITKESVIEEQTNEQESKLQNDEETIHIIKNRLDSSVSDFEDREEEQFSLIDSRYVIGNPSGTFYQKPNGLSQQNMPFFRNDNVSDALQLGSSLLLAASSKGSLHQSGTSPRQDSYAYGVFEQGEEKWIILAISDGVSASPYSHILAEYLTFSSVKELKLQLKTTNTFEIQDFAIKINEMANDFCKKQLVKQNQHFDVEKYSAQMGANYFGTTLECAVIHLEKDKSSVTHFTISGDGGAYIFNKSLAINVVKSGKTRGEDIVSNAVSPLPLDSINEINITKVDLEEGDIFFITTDGLADFIGNGNSNLGNFLLKKLIDVKDSVEFLKIINVSMFQLDDDKTAICFKIGDVDYG